MQRLLSAELTQGIPRSRAGPKEFARQGHDVTVLTPKDPEEHPPFEKEYGVTIKDLGQPRWKEVEIKGSGLILLIRRALRRFSNLLFEYPNIELMGMVKRALRKESGYDLMISIAVPYPIHWGVASVRSEEHPVAKTWIADCGDPYMGQENDTFKPPFYFGYLEKKFCRKADFITVPVEGAIDAYYPEFRNKIRVIPQGFRFEDIELQEKPHNNGRPGIWLCRVVHPGKEGSVGVSSWLAGLDRDYEFHIYTTHPEIGEPWISREKCGTHSAKGSCTQYRTAAPHERDGFCCQL
jgi:hypothetical protein